MSRPGPSCRYRDASGRDKVLRFVFLSLTVLFWLLAARDSNSSALVGRISQLRWDRLRLSAVYLAMAKVIN